MCSYRHVQVRVIEILRYYHQCQHQYIFEGTLLLGPTRHTDEVDAIPIAILVRDVVAQMRSGRTDALSIGEASHKIPVHLLIAEAGPSVRLALLQVLLHRPSHGGGEEQLPGDGIVVLRGILAIHLVEEGRGGPVSGVLGVVAIEIADPVGRVVVALPPEILLDGLVARTVLLLAHDLLGGGDGELLPGSEGEGSSHGSGGGWCEGAGQRRRGGEEEGYLADDLHDGYVVRVLRKRKGVVYSYADDVSTSERRIAWSHAVD